MASASRAGRLARTKKTRFIEPEEIRQALSPRQPTEEQVAYQQFISQPEGKEFERLFTPEERIEIRRRTGVSAIGGRGFRSATFIATLKRAVARKKSIEAKEVEIEEELEDIASAREEGASAEEIGQRIVDLEDKQMVVNQERAELGLAPEPLPDIEFQEPIRTREFEPASPPPPLLPEEEADPATLAPAPAFPPENRFESLEQQVVKRIHDFPESLTTDTSVSTPPSSARTEETLPQREIPLREVFAHPRVPLLPLAGLPPPDPRSSAVRAVANPRLVRQATSSHDILSSDLPFTSEEETQASIGRASTQAGRTPRTERTIFSQFTRVPRFRVEREREEKQRQGLGLTFAGTTPTPERASLIQNLRNQQRSIKKLCGQKCFSDSQCPQNCPRCISGRCRK